MRPTLFLVLLAVPAWPQAGAQATLSVPCSIRIRSPRAADYDLTHEFTLKGVVVDAQDGVMRLRLLLGVVRVRLGQGFPAGAVRPGQAVSVLAARSQDDSSQWFVAREVRRAEGILVLRDADGVPVD
jgi:hypothetical protein